jgi:hypothetical protein
VLFCAVSDAIGMSHKTPTRAIDARAARCFLLSGRDLTQVVEMAGFEAERALFIRSWAVAMQARGWALDGATIDAMAALDAALCTAPAVARLRRAALSA